MDKSLEFELDILDYEILGSSLIILGYLNFIQAGRDEKLKLCNKPYSINPGFSFFIGEKFVFYGISVLTYVSSKRYDLAIENNNLEELEALSTICFAYKVSLLANYYRLISLGSLLNFQNLENLI